ncbi:flavin monoamine oxidase family protein (plasmid) [Streptomyces sp. BI20]|uniref:flavin monoamine oxidase family protein n=1 Tax=Streptomyces sp. BI20 TaxID=3403460 RepID=UPI003C70E254
MTAPWQEIDGREGAGAPKRVTVLGAGMAGLVAAYELERLGHRVEVLEAAHTLGGRVRTHRFAGANGPFAELGAMRIPAGHRLTLHYTAELGLQDHVREFRTLFSDDAAYLTTDTGHLRVREAHDTLVAEYAAKLPDPGAHRPDTLLFGAWLDASIRAIAPRAFYEGQRDDVGERRLLSLIDGIDLTPYRRGPELRRMDLHAFFADHPRVRAAGPGRLERFLDDVLDETGSTIVRLREGMDHLPRRLAARIRGPIHTGREVTGIDVREDEVLLTVRHGARTALHRSRYVVCTVPFTVLRGMRLAGFDRDKLDIVHGTRYWPATKIALHCREPFWEKDGIGGGASFTGGHVRQTYYPPAEGDPELGAVLLASYTIGPDAEELGRLTETARTALVLRELSALHPRLREPGMVLGTAGLAWGEHRWSRGAATIRWEQDAGLREAERREAARPQKGLFFAGEHCSTTPAWIEGAIESAIDVAHEIEWYEPRAGRVFAAARAGRTGGAA